MTLGELKQAFRKALTASYPTEEVDALFFMAIEFLMGYSRINYMLNTNQPLTDDQMQKYLTFLTELSKGKPIQHLIGSTEFYGLKFKVNQHTLIPRPETEELIELILVNHPNDTRTVLDVGTGSGCIPLSLKNNRTQWKVTSCDISEQALDIARQNASDLNLNINLLHLNIFDESNYNNLPQCDIIVSNPPYVTNSEKKLMHKNVLEHDPHLALFVPDSNPLLFYKAICRLASIKLNKGGWLYFEINEAFGQKMLELLDSFQFINLSLVKDINNKDRFIYGQLA